MVQPQSQGYGCAPGVTQHDGTVDAEDSEGIAEQFSLGSRTPFLAASPYEATFNKLADVKLLDSAGEELLADDALELAERVNLRTVGG